MEAASGLPEVESWTFSTNGRGASEPYQDAIGAGWCRAISDAGIEGPKLHDCRNFFPSGLISQGCDVVTVWRALGHATPTTTPNTAGHLWPTAEDRTRRAEEAILSEALNPNTENLADSMWTSEDR